MVHTSSASLIYMLHPVLVVQIVVEQNRLTSMMQCLLDLVVAVDPQDQPSVVLPRRISPFVMKTVVAPVVVLVRNSVRAPVLLSAPAVYLVPLSVFLLFLHRMHQSVPLKVLHRPSPVQTVVLFLR